MKIVLTSEGVNLDKPTRRYVEKLVGGLDTYAPKADRNELQAAVVLRRVDRPHGNKYEAEVTINAPTYQIVAKDTTLNVLAALDIVRAKLIAELKNR